MARKKKKGIVGVSFSGVLGIHKEDEKKAHKIMTTPVKGLGKTRFSSRGVTKSVFGSPKKFLKA